MLLFASTTG